MYGSKCWAAKRTHERRVYMRWRCECRDGCLEWQEDRIWNEYNRGSYKVAPSDGEESLIKRKLYKKLIIKYINLEDKNTWVCFFFNLIKNNKAVVSFLYLPAFVAKKWPDLRRFKIILVISINKESLSLRNHVGHSKSFLSYWFIQILHNV